MHGKPKSQEKNKKFWGPDFENERANAVWLESPH